MRNERFRHAMGLFPWAQILRPGPVLSRAEGLSMTIWCGSPPGGRACSCLVGLVPEQGNADVLRALVILGGTQDLAKPRDGSNLGTDALPRAPNDNRVRALPCQQVFVSWRRVRLLFIPLLLSASSRIPVVDDWTNSGPITDFVCVGSVGRIGRMRVRAVVWFGCGAVVPDAIAR